MTTTLPISPTVQFTGSTTGQFSIGSSPLIRLLAIGDVVEFQLAKIEQLVSLSGWNYTATGETATRTLVWQFRWRNNGAFSAWISLTTPNIAAIVPDDDQPFYIEVRATRSGADATGILTIFAVSFNYNYNVLALSGHGCLVDLTLQHDLFNLFAACIQFKMPKSGSNRERTEVVDQWPNGQSNTGGLVPIYIFDLRRRESANTAMGGNYSEFRWSMQVAIKTVGQDKGDLVQGAPLYKLACDIIRRLFDPTTWHVESYDITFKTVTFLALTFNQLGIYNFTLEDRGTGIANADTYQTFQITFAIETNRIIKYGYSSNH